MLDPYRQMIEKDGMEVKMVMKQLSHVACGSTFTVVLG